MFCFILTCFTVCSCESSITDTVTTDAFSSVAAISSSHTVNSCMCTHIHYTEQIEQRYSWVVKTTTYTRYYDLQLATASFGRFLPNTEVFFRRFGSFVGVSGLRRAIYHAGWFLMACFIWSLVSSMRARSVCRTANIVASICASPSYIYLYPWKLVWWHWQFWRFRVSTAEYGTVWSRFAEFICTPLDLNRNVTIFRHILIHSY